MTFEQWLISVVQQGLPPVVKENCVIYKRVSLACEALNREQLIATIWMAAVHSGPDISKWTKEDFVREQEASQ